MGQPIFVQMAQRPATTAVITLCTGLWLHAKQRGLGYPELGMSYDAVVHRRQYWRLVVSQLSHVDLPHILLNMTSLWSLGAAAEQHPLRGSPYYLRMSLVMLLLSSALTLSFTRLLVQLLGRSQQAQAFSLGYSCVVFGWMTAIALDGSSGAGFGLLSLGSVPAWLAPILALLLTSLLVPNASFLGHLSGIVAGGLVALGLFDWVTGYWAGCLCMWVAIGVVYGLAKENKLRAVGLGFLDVRLPAAADVESGGALAADVPMVRGGILVRG